MADTYVAQLLSYYTAGLTLLLRISQSRHGAASVMNAGLFSAIRESGLFAADPDIGLGMLLCPYISPSEISLPASSTLPNSSH